MPQRAVRGRLGALSILSYIESFESRWPNWGASGMPQGIGDPQPLPRLPLWQGFLLDHALARRLVTRAVLPVYGGFEAPGRRGRFVWPAGRDR